ncbi:MAG TPA: hypothetical protein VEK08_07330 [Planctomycetota bacterium]|nr:hypothetical protein [Planctomycetota bacterium]
MKTISTRHLQNLPALKTLERLCLSLATLDKFVSTEDDSGYCWYTRDWDEGCNLAGLNSGCYDEVNLCFMQSGAFIAGCDHEAPMSPKKRWFGMLYPGIKDGFPEMFQRFLNEEVFHWDDVTFLIWKRSPNSRWEIGNIQFPEGPDPDGSERLLQILDGDPLHYQRHALENFKANVSLSDISRVYRHEPITAELVERLSAGRKSLDDDLREELTELGYPVV